MTNAIKQAKIEAATELEKRLSRYIADPNLAVLIRLYKKDVENA